MTVFAPLSALLSLLFFLSAFVGARLPCDQMLSG